MYFLLFLLTSFLPYAVVFSSCITPLPPKRGKKERRSLLLFSMSYACRFVFLSSLHSIFFFLSRSVDFCSKPPLSTFFISFFLCSYFVPTLFLLCTFSFTTLMMTSVFPSYHVLTHWLSLSIVNFITLRAQKTEVFEAKATAAGMSLDGVDPAMRKFLAGGMDAESFLKQRKS